MDLKNFIWKVHYLNISKEEDSSQAIKEVLQSNIFNAMLSRRSERKLDVNKTVEDWKIEMIFAAADTAPTAGGFQGFEIYHIKSIDIKLIDAANR
jgi:FMN reductase [NAD(P)H]